MPCNCCSPDEPQIEPFIDPDSLIQRCPLDNGPKDFRLSMVDSRSIDWKDCKVQALPTELYQNCLKYLDVGSLTTIRRVSQYTRCAIDSLHQYKVLYEHAKHVLRACLRTGIAGHIPLLRLHYALTSMECYYCKTSDTPSFQFGSYLSLHTGDRICLCCLRNDQRLKTTELQILVGLFSNPRTNISSIAVPRLRILPGAYNGPLCPQNLPMFPTTLVLSSTILPKPGVDFLAHEKRAIVDKKAIFGASTIAGTSDVSTIIHNPLMRTQDESDINPTRHYLGPETPKQVTHRYASAIVFPYVPASKSIADYGVFCTECVLSMRYREYAWHHKQQDRAFNGRSTIASERTVKRINDGRKSSCTQYLATDEAQKEAAALPEEHRGAGIAVHKLTHDPLTLSVHEIAWRKKLKGPPLFGLGHDRSA